MMGLVIALYGETIKLTQDINSISGACVKLDYKEGITFDCDHYKITGTGGGSSANKGIDLNQYNINNNIKNCSVSNFSFGVYVYRYSSNNIFENIIANNNDCTASYCIGAGFYFGYNSIDNNLINITANNNERGIDINSDSNDLSNIIAEHNNNGIYIDSYSHNTITHSTSTNNNSGLYLRYSDNTIASSSVIKLNTTDINIPYSGAENNLFYNNELVARDKIVDQGTNTLWDNGALDGGNNWEMFNQDTDCYDDEGVEVCCTGGLYCENAYKIDDGTVAYDGGASVDNFPIRDPATPQEHLCETCKDCSAKISQAVVGDTVKLTKDIIGHSGTCIDFGDSVGIIFDGQDYLINGSNDDYGIYIHGSVSGNNTVKNCNISSFNKGVLLSSTNSNNLINITANNNYYGVRSDSSNSNIFNEIDASNNIYGLYINGGSSNSFTNVVANYNNDSGIYLTISNNNTLTNITVNNNIGTGFGTGIYFNGNSSSFFNNIVAINNNYGIYLKGGWYNKSYFGATVSNNTIVDSTIKWNTTNDIYISNPDSSSYDNTVQDNVFYNNKLIASSTIYDDGYLTHWNKWDSASGDQKPGNHWEAFDSDSEGCFDTDSDGYCDNKYEDIPTKNYDDNYPKYIGSITTFYCNSCADCNEKIASSTNGSTIYLANDISDVDVNGHCLDFSDDKQNLVFDCQGHTLTGDTTGNGIYLNNSNSGGNGANFIKNCVIENFNIGVNIADSDNNTIASSTIKKNTTDAQINNLSDDNIFHSNEFLNENKMSDNGVNTHWNNWSGADSAPGNHWEEYDEPVESCDDNVLALWIILLNMLVRRISLNAIAAPNAIPK